LPHRERIHPQVHPAELQAFTGKLILHAEVNSSPMDGARAHLIWELETAGRKDLERAIREAREYVHHYPNDYKVADALERAQRRQREQQRR
jgi:hypothetical protein